MMTLFCPIKGMKTLNTFEACKVFEKCNQIINCKVSQKTGPLVAELKKEILSKAAIYKKQNKDKNFKEYKGSKRLSK